MEFLAAFLLATAALAPTTGDFGLTYDEPAYTYSQQTSVQWWERLAAARSWADVAPLLDADALLYYWPYARHGINFHPPLAGQANLATHAVLHRWFNDTVARRAATVLAFAATIALLHTFLARRYGRWVGAVAGLSLLVMPRLYGQAHLIDTDIPGLLLWVAAALAFWNATRVGGRRWRPLVGLLLGLAFLEKMATVGVVVPLTACLAVLALRRRGDGRRDLAALDALLTIGPILTVLAVTYLEIRRLIEVLPPPAYTNLFVHRPKTWLPGAVLATPWLWWLLRRGLARALPRHAVWGADRPVVETLAAMLAWPPLVAWLGNPAWWKETIPRLAHYASINASRRGALPDIQILYFGQLYEFSLPWENAFVLTAITVPVSLLAAGLAGLVWGVRRAAFRDFLPVYFFVHMLTLPILRMFPTPAHDGVRLFLPTFAFLAAFCGGGVVAAADGLARLAGGGRTAWRAGVAALALAPAAWSLVKIHPYELSYYNALIGGPRGAWERGFELTYWYDAFTPGVIAELNDRLPRGAHVTFPNSLSSPSTFQDLQALGVLRGDIRLGVPEDDYPFLWLLTHDSKATANTRLLFALTPWYASTPAQLDGLRVATVADPHAAALSTALQLLTDDAGKPPPEPQAPDWVRTYAPWLSRLWGVGLTRVPSLGTHEPSFAWAVSDPEGMRRAARRLVERVRAGKAPAAPSGDADVDRLAAIVTRYDRGAPYSAELLRRRPAALVEAVEILIRRPEAVRRVLTRYGYTDPATIGGYLDRDLPGR
jgi:4-amino-4-deoxy-L-arabinose transferase-like glycosyltransferase